MENATISATSWNTEPDRTNGQSEDIASMTIRTMVS